MRIRDFRLEVTGSSSKASAAIEWEDSPRPSQRLTFSVRGEFRPAFEPAPEAFVLSAALAAARGGERRVWVDGALCAVFAHGLRSGFVLLDSWYGGSRSSTALEAARGFRTRSRPAPAAGMFLSGGVDSLHLLRRNRLDFPRSHPASFRAIIHVRSFGFTGEADEDAARNIADRALPSVARVAESEQLGLALVESDARLLEPDRRFFILESHGSLLAATAHLFPGAFSSVSIAASADLRRTFRPWGSHPLLDSLYSSGATKICHSGHAYSRLEKVAELSLWELALATLLVCNEAPLEPGIINCGRCEKCQRTLCELLAAGALPKASTFGFSEVTPESIRSLPIVEDYAIRRWQDVRLHFANRPELRAAVEEWIARLRTAAAWKEDRGWKGGLRRLDRTLLRGRLLALRRRWSEPS